MKLPLDELLAGARDLQGLRALVDLADQVLHTWQPSWSDFLDAPLREEAMERLGSLSDLQWQCHGGHPGAERCRLLCQRRDAANDLNPPLCGLLIEGNFLFDPLSPADLRHALQSMGVSPGELGDLWVRGDRGGQGICTPAGADLVHERCGSVRDVAIRCEAVPIDHLQLPAQRAPRRFHTVEASRRLDAIASAGFGLSRAKVVTQIRAGHLRLNWQAIRQPSRELMIGDRLQLQDRGNLEVLALQPTKRQRWRVELKRS